MSNPLTIEDIEKKINELGGKIVEIKDTLKSSPQNINTNLVQFKQDINEILQSIDVISGSEYKGGKIYIRLLLRDIVDPNKQSRYFSLNPVTPTSLFKAEIDLLKKLVNDIPKIKEKITEALVEFQPPIDPSIQLNIKTAINAIDSTIGL
jgi:hypothetical protein